MKRIIDNFHFSERERYLTKFSSYSLKDLTGIIDKYKVKLSNDPKMFKDVLRYFNELHFRANFTLYEQNKEVYSSLLKGFNEDIIKTEAFHDAFFAFNCIEFGKLISDYYSNNIQQQYRTIAKDLITELEMHQTFFERCQYLYENKQYGKYYVIGIKRLLKLIEITENSQDSDPIDTYLSQYNVHLNYDADINIRDFLKQFDVAIFMSTCAERNLTTTFDEIYPIYDQWRSQQELLLYSIKERKKLSKYDLSDNRPHKKLPDAPIKISAKDLKKRKRKYPTD